MNRIISRSIFDDVFSIADAFSGKMFDETRSLVNNGLKRLISRPHNLIDVKDENGNVVAQRLEVVTTPFAKEDVSIEISKNVLTVTCGKENIKNDDNEEVVYRGISSQTYTFSLTLPSNVDKTAIKAINKDGVLKITLPFANKVEPEVMSINID